MANETREQLIEQLRSNDKMLAGLIDACALLTEANEVLGDIVSEALAMLNHTVGHNNCPACVIAKRMAALQQVII